MTSQDQAHRRTAAPPASAELRVLPWDEANQQLVSHVHPPGWRNPTPQPRYHLVVIGAGTAGLVTAIVAANLGARVALVERHLMGGDCLNVGCVPSKSVIAAARAWDQRRRRAFGAPAAAGPGDFALAMARMRRLRARISAVDGAPRFRDAGVDVFLGQAHFSGPDTVEVAGARLRFRRAVIATGARPQAPPIPGLADVPFLTNETVFTLTELPPRLAVIGGGPIGCELAQAFARLGSAVSVLDIAPHLLPREDRDAAEVVQRALAADGVRLELGVALERVEHVGGDVVLRFARGEQRGCVRADQVLVSVGRAPNVEGLELERVGVRYDRTGVLVDDHLRTSNRRIFAAGDVVPSFKFTHLADAHAGIVIKNALFFGRARHGSLVVPWCTYTTPEIAHVGLYADEAQRRGISIDTITLPLEEVDRALLDGEEEGFLRLHLASGSDRILGATVVAHHAGDLIGTLSLAITHRIGLARFAGTIFPYPTQAEALKKAANAWRKQKLTPGARRLFAAFFRLSG